MSGDLSISERYNMNDMVAFMRSDDVYWSASDALAPQPEQMDFASYLLHPDVYSLAATYKGQVIGYVIFNRRTSIGAEIHCGFHKHARGKIAKTFVEAAIAWAFGEKGLLKLWAVIPSDNRAAVMGARMCGFKPEGCLRNAIVRRGVEDGKPPLRDLVILGKSKLDTRN